MPISRSCLMLLSFVLAVPAVSFADDAASRAIIEKAIERNGGEKELARFKASTSSFKGTFQLNGTPVSFTGDVAAQGSDQQRLSISLQVDGQMIAFTSVLNRDQGWQKVNENTADMTAEQLTEAKANAYSSWVSTLLPLKDKAFTLAPFGEIEIGDRKVVGVNVTREGRRSITLFFDKESLRLVRTETTVRDEMTSKEVTEEINYTEFKEQDGIPYATKLVIKRNGQPHLDLEIIQLKPVEKLDDSLFAKP